MLKILNENLYTTEEVCNMFGMTEGTLRKHIKAGRIKPTKIHPKNYFSEIEINNLLTYLKSL